jgi:hypothetical protein
MPIIGMAVQQLCEGHSKRAATTVASSTGDFKSR